MERYIMLPQYGELDMKNIPEDFEEKIKKAFLRYTEGTRKEYRYVDRMGFIDCCVKYIRRGRYDDEEEAVKRIILDREEFNLNEYGELPDRDEYWSLEFMGEVYRQGVNDALLYNSGEDTKWETTHLIHRIVKAVMEVKDDD